MGVLPRAASARPVEPRIESHPRGDATCPIFENGIPHRESVRQVGFPGQTTGLGTYEVCQAELVIFDAL